MKKKSKMKRKFSPLFCALGIILTIYVISLFIPLIWAFLAALKEPAVEYMENMLGFPREIYFGNFLNVFSKFNVPIEGGEPVYFFEMLANSLLYAVGNAFFHVAIIFIVAYAAARFKFVVGKFIYFTVILGMILPLVGSQPSMLALANKLRLIDTMWGQWLMNAHYLGMYFLVMHATLLSFPKDYDEAAQIDGASNLTVMLKIMFPLCITTFCTIFLLMFIQHWNNYTSPMLFMPNIPTLSYGLWTFVESTDPVLTNDPSRLAGCVVVAIPTLVLFLIFHDRLLNNVSIGGVKE